jgi:ribosomal protein L11 methyltransferase
MTKTPSLVICHSSFAFPMHWLEVSLTVNGEAAEAVADVLTRFAPEGVAIEATQFEVTPEDVGQPVGPMIVRAYLRAGVDLEVTRARLEEALWHLGQLLPLPPAQYQSIADADWSEAWKANFHPIRVGKRLIVIPAWLDPPLAVDDVPVRLDPGMAFGTGTHPTTQLCLAAIERHLTPAMPVIDVGTGSGILAIAAAKLGSGRVLAVDIDEAAVRVARENVVANGVAEGVRVEQGSVAELRAGRFGVQAASLVVANILARTIIALLDEGLAQLAVPGGLLIVSGILDSQAYEVTAALKQHDCVCLAQEHIEDWVAILARRAA